MSPFTQFRRSPAQGQPTLDDELTPGTEDVESEPADTADTETTATTDTTDTTETAAGAETGKHPVTGLVWTVLAGLMVVLPLVAPDDISHPTVRVFARLPLEVLVAAAVILVLPARARRVVAAVAGVALGLLAILKIVDLGFYLALARPFDLVLDWVLLGDAMGVLSDSIGRVGAVAAVIGAGLLVIAGLVLMTLSVLRLSRLAAGHRTGAIRAVAVYTIAWVACAATGAHLVPGVPVATSNTAGLVYDSVQQVRAGLHDRQTFAKEAAVDAFRNTPGQDLLTGLRGKDVVLTFVESYGRDAVEDPSLSPQVDAVLDAGTRRLNAAGFASRSAFLTSSTVGGGSWLAHASLLSGLWINSQQRYRSLVTGNRLTLSGAFQRAGWRTVSVEPAISLAWPEQGFFGYDQGYNSRNLGYHGPHFSYATMPDQYTLAAFERAEHGVPGHKPLMAEITLLSSHTPWTPTPSLIDWDSVGDGSVFGPMAKSGDSPSAVWRNRTRIRTAYRESIEYSLNTLISYVEKYGDKNLVLVFLGDHQPAPIITGAGASRQVPITIVAHDPAVLNRISSWGWQPGLRPGPKAPSWRMDAFRDRFLTAFGR